MNKLHVLDLFAGAGGLSLGFEQTGAYNIVMGVEINQDAIKTYNKNHLTQITAMDINNINFKDTKKYPAFKKIDVIIGGPPCQGFSNANRQKSQLFSTNNLLVKEFVRAIEELNPIAFVMENVKTINSPTHKFFVTENESNDISQLGLNSLSTEIINIGNMPKYNKQLFELFTQNLLNNTFMDQEYASKLKSLLRYYKRHKNIKGFLKKNKNFFTSKTVNQSFYYQHYSCFSLLSSTFYTALQDYYDSNHASEQIYHLALEILELNTIISNLKEIKDKKILSSISLDNSNGLTIQIATYTVIDYLKKKFHQLGYDIDKSNGILNAADFGVPQFRNRYFIIGIKNKSAYLPKPLPLQRHFTIGDALRDIKDIECSYDINSKPQLKPTSYFPSNPLAKYLHSDSPFLHNHIITQTRDTALKRFANLKPGQNFHDLDESLKSTYANTERTQNTVYKRLCYSDISNTVVNVRKSMWIHPEHNRAVSIREAARLQSFPDNYIFVGKKDAQYQQVGNAVPPLLARGVAESLLIQLGIAPNKNLIDILK